MKIIKNLIAVCDVVILYTLQHTVDNNIAIQEQHRSTITMCLSFTCIHYTFTWCHIYVIIIIVILIKVICIFYHLKLVTHASYL